MLRSENQQRASQERSTYEDALSTPPQEVKDTTLRASEEYPNKKIISHFVQPHAPYIGNYAKSDRGIKYPFVEYRENNKDVDVCSAKKGYRENLNIVLEYVYELVNNLQGKTVITSDHGELFWERAWPFPWKEFHHPRLLAEKLLQVPWVEVEDDTRRTTKSENPIEDCKDISDEKVEENLENLGYI